MKNARTQRVIMIAAALTVGFGRTGRAATLTWDSSGTNPTTPVDGSGTWDTSTANWSDGTADNVWPNDTASVAVFGADDGAAGTVNLGTAIVANGITFNAPGSGNYTIAGVNTLTLGGTAPTITVVGGLSPTITAAITGTAGVAVAQSGTGAAQLTLSGTNTFTGGMSIGTGAQVNFTTNGNLGGSGSGVILNGGTLNYAGTTAPTITHAITIGGTGGTVNTQMNGGAGKFTLNSGGQFAGNAGGALTKTGPGWLTIYGAAATGSNFTTAVNGGVVEVGNQTALGSSTTSTVTVNAGGELALNSGANKAVANNVTVNGGTIGADAVSQIYSGTVTFQSGSTSNIRLGNFYSSGAQSLTIGGSLAGGGTINLSNGVGATAPSGQLLALTGSNGNFTGTINIDPGHSVNFGAASLNTATPSVPTNGSIVVTSSTTALPVVGFGNTATPTNPSPAPPSITDNTATNGGVFAYNGGAYNHNLDLATLYNGHWFLGSDTGGSFFGSIAPGVDGNGNPLYRLGGGGGANLNVFPVLTDSTNAGATSVQIGDPRINGGGGIRYEVPMTYTGGTAIVNGTLTLGTANGVSGALPATTLVTFGAAANATAGTSASNGTLDLLGLNTPVGGLTVAAGATAAGQVVTNSSPTANSVLTVDTSNFSSTFAGVIKNGTSKTIGLTVQASTSGNTLTLTGTNTYTGPTTAANGGTLLVNGSLAATPVAVATGGTLGGTGTIAGAVTVSGTITAGGAGVNGSTGTLTNTGLQTWNASGGYVAKVAGNANITSNDALVLSSLTVTSGFSVSLLATNGSSPAFTAQNADTTGTVAGAPAGSYIVLARDTDGSGSNPFANPTTISNLSFSPGTVASLPGDAIQLAGLSDSANGSYDLVAEDVAAPEPTSLLLAGAAAAPLWLTRRRRRRTVAR